MFKFNGNIFKTLALVVLWLYTPVGGRKIFAQNVNLRNNQYLKYASRSAEMSDYITAAEMLEHYLEIKPGNNKVKVKLAGYYFRNKQYAKALDLIDDLAKSGWKSDKLLFLSGQCLKASGEYEKAIKLFEQCRKKTRNKSLSTSSAKEIVGCKAAIESMYEPKDVSIKNLENLNTKSQESSPVYLNDSVIIFSSMNLDRVVEIPIYDSVVVSRNKLFYGYLSDSNWYKGKILPPVVNDENYYIANGAFSLNGDRFYYTKCSENWLNHNVCKLYYCTYNKYRYGMPESIDLGINNLQYTATHPTTGETYDSNYEVIYFASDMPGGLGGIDLWYIVYNRVKHSFTSPKNLGSHVNTKYNEVTPFYNNKTKTLYFSSDRPDSFGGYDIFKSTGSLKSWSTVRNIGYPFCTNADDMYFILNHDQVDGFLVSNRTGSKKLADEYCCYDINSFHINSTNRVMIKGNLMAAIDPSIEKYLNKGIEMSSPDSLPEYNLQVALYLYANKLADDSLFIATDTIGHDGSYSFAAEPDNEYKLFFFNDNTIESSLEVSTKDIDDKSKQDIAVKPLTLAVLPKQALKINNINYEFGSSNLTKNAKQAIDSSILSLLFENPALNIEINSHTDSVGGLEYNYKLSDLRAKNVVKYLISKGIDSNRLSYHGYGESFPLYPNTNPDGTDNVEGREKNRRTEFKILSKNK